MSFESTDSRFLPSRSSSETLQSWSSTAFTAIGQACNRKRIAIPYFSALYKVAATLKNAPERHLVKFARDDPFFDLLEHDLLSNRSMIRQPRIKKSNALSHESILWGFATEVARLKSASNADIV